MLPFRSFPEYYELIQRPVDLTSIKKAIASGAYSSVQEALSDIRLVWANCQQFNADGSDISDIAIELAAKTEEFVQVGADVDSIGIVIVFTVISLGFVFSSLSFV